MTVPQITLEQYVEAETAINEADNWSAELEAMLLHYGGAKEEAMPSYALDDVLGMIGQTSRLRSAIIGGRADEPQAVTLEDGTVLLANRNLWSYSNARFSDAEVYLSVFSGPRLFPPLASVIFWPEGKDYSTEEATARQKALLNLPAYLIVPEVLFFCKTAMTFAADSPASTKKPAAARTKSPS